MVSARLQLDQTWRLLWSYTAHKIISTLPFALDYERVAVGLGWGLRHPSDPRRAILLHPAGVSRAIGDLALTIPGIGTHVIARYDLPYIDYIADVTSVVETVGKAYLVD